MATSLCPNLRISKEHNCVTEWLDMFENAASVFTFAHADKLPTNAEEKTAKKAELMRTLLTVNLGPDALKKSHAFTFPDEIKDTTYATLRKTLVDRLLPKTNIVAQQQKFMTLNQITGESLCTFMSRLKEAANVCQFGDLFDLMVRTRFVAGLSSERIRAELISESAANDTSASLFEKAQTQENALQSSVSVTTHYVQKPGKFQKLQSSKFQQKADLSIVCSRCTVRGHVAKNCKVRCRNCRKPGHITKNCRSAKKQSHCVEGIGDHDDDNACAADYGYTHQVMENTLYCVETADPVQVSRFLYRLLFPMVLFLHQLLVIYPVVSIVIRNHFLKLRLMIRF